MIISRYISFINTLRYFMIQTARYAI